MNGSTYYTRTNRFHRFQTSNPSSTAHLLRTTLYMVESTDEYSEWQNGKMHVLRRKVTKIHSVGIWKFPLSATVCESSVPTMLLAYVSSRYRDHGRSSRRPRIFLPAIPSSRRPETTRGVPMARWSDASAEGTPCALPGTGIGRRRASARLSTRIDFTPSPLRFFTSPRLRRPSPSSSSFIRDASLLSLSLLLSLCRSLESARTRSRTPFAARATRARRNKERTRNERTRGTRGTQRKVTRFTDNARKPREHATREIEKEREKEREGETERTTTREASVLQLIFTPVWFIRPRHRQPRFSCPRAPTMEKPANQSAYTTTPVHPRLSASSPRFMDFHDDSF